MKAGNIKTLNSFFCEAYPTSSVCVWGEGLGAEQVPRCQPQLLAGDFYRPQRPQRPRAHGRKTPQKSLSMESADAGGSPAFTTTTAY